MKLHVDEDVKLRLNFDIKEEPEVNHILELIKEKFDNVKVSALVVNPENNEHIRGIFINKE